MTEPALLDESAMSKIEARIAKRDDTTALESACGEYNCSCRYDLPALCATVKHLRQQLKLSEDWRGTALRERDEAERLLDAVRKRADTNHAALNDLQSQLEQLRAEYERLKNDALKLSKVLADELKRQ